MTASAQLARRVLLLALVFSVEAVMAARGDNSRYSGWFSQYLLPGIVRSGIVFATLSLGVAWLRYREALAKLAGLAIVPLNLRFMAVHVAAYALLVWLTLGIRSTSLSDASFDLLNCARIGLAGAVVALGTLAAVSPLYLRAVFKVTGPLCGYAALGALLVLPGIALTDVSWDAVGVPVSRVTLRVAHGMLHPIRPDLKVDLHKLTLGTPRFGVLVGSGCSGLEGVCLLLAFSVVWLSLFRRELRLWRAAVLIPLSVCLLFLLNSLRIAALILIGDSGWPDVAMHGFHSQAGWIAFNAVAFGMVVAANRSGWAFAAPQERNSTADFLVPFLSILAAGMAAQAFSGGFEWAYGLRVFAAAIALIALRRGYANVDWRFGWLAPVAGVLVFVLWIARDQGSVALPAALQASSAGIRVLWISLRVAGAVITVPIAEELAFRGYAMRRLVTEDFSSVPFTGAPWFALVISSALFGATHGSRWIEGVAAGLIFGCLVRRSGKLGDAVAAHAMANALIAAYVLIGGHWQYW